MTTPGNTVDAASLARLRDLRLWHYRQLVKCRGLARQAVSSSQVSRYNADADTHLHYVQTLNDYFPHGDTAEADAV